MYRKVSSVIPSGAFQARCFQISCWPRAEPPKQALDPAPAKDTGQVSRERGTLGPHRRCSCGPLWAEQGGITFNFLSAPLSETQIPLGIIVPPQGRKGFVCILFPSALCWTLPYNLVTIHSDDLAIQKKNSPLTLSREKISIIHFKIA